MNLIASYWAIAGDTVPGDGSELSPFDFKRRMEVAGRVGFRGAGFVHADLNRIRDSLGWSEARTILAANGIEDVEVEVLEDWFASGERRARSDEIRRDLLAAAAGLGARHLKVVSDMKGGSWPLDGMAEDFAALCKQAEDVGSKVAIEVMPWANLNTIGKGLEVTRAAGADNGGILLDVWHLARGSGATADVALLEGRELISVELEDAAAEPIGTLWNDALNHRLPCGEGCLDIAGFVDAIRRIGYQGPAGVEILSIAHRKLSLEEAAKVAYESTRRFVP
jgi:sugar phosphate isomerase/epimerase